MDKNDTVIVVGATELDGYGHLWVTPQGGGDRIKIAQKRESLHPLFQQGQAVILHWETYRNIPYVADAKLVESELPPAQKPITPDTGNIPVEKPPMSGAETGRCWNDIRELWIHDKMATLFGRENAIEIAKQYRGYLLSTLKLNYDGAKLPKWETKEKTE